MKLIDRYVAEIGKHLPEKLRADIETEIRSTLEDMLEERSQKTGHPVDEEMTAEVLKEYGDPKKVADSYLPEHYLIGPRLYPMFTLVLKIVFSVLTVIALIGLGVEFSKTSMTLPAFMETFANFIVKYAGGALQAFGNIVIVFAILQWTLPASEFDDNKEKWDPALLTEEPEPDEIRPRGLIWESAFTIAALMIFNFYPQLIDRVGLFSDGKWVSIPVLSEAFYHFLPWISAVWLLEIIQNIVLLRRGRWEPATRWFAVAIKIASIALAYALLSGPSLVGITPEALASAMTAPLHTAVTIVAMSDLGVRIAMIVVIIVEGIEVIRAVYRMLKPKGAPVILGK